MKTSDNNLIEKYLDGTATPAEFAVFEERLRSNPATRLDLLQECGFESQLRVLLKTSPVVSLESAEAAGTNDVEESSLLPQPRQTVYWRPAWLWIPAAAAAAALVAAVVFPLLPTRSNSHDVILNGGRAFQPAIPELADRNVRPPFHNNFLLVSNNVPAPSDSAVLSTEPSDGGVTVSAQPVVATDGPVLDHRVVGMKPENPPVAPRAIDQAMTLHPAAPMHVRNIPGNVVAMALPDGGRANVTAPSVATATNVTAVAAVAAASPRSDGQFASANGNIFLTRLAGANNKARHVVQSGELFMPGDVIETGPSSGGTLQYTDGSAVRLYSNTQLTLGQTDNSRNLLLASGAIDLRVQSQEAGHNLIVHTSYIEARVVGTEFRVMTDGSGSWVGVKAGRVEVVRLRANGEVVRLEPGYYASSSRGWPPLAISDPNWRSKCQAFTGSSKYP
jgi:hypothetical protein